MDQEFVMLSIDIGEGQPQVQAFAQERGLTFPILLDETGSAAQNYLIRAIPYSLLVDREGVIRAQHVGPMDEALIADFLGPLL
jgi:peroxiredoxin